MRLSLTIDAPRRRILALALLGLVQGLVLWWLARQARPEQWPFPLNSPALFAWITLVVGLLPPLAMLGFGHWRGRVLAAWMVGAAALLAVMAWFETALFGTELPSRLLPQAGLALLALHWLLGAGLARRGPEGGRLWPSYPALYHEHGQLALRVGRAVVFVVVFWLVLIAGAQLFVLIGLDGLWRLLRRDTFTWPLTGLILGAALAALPAGEPPRMSQLGWLTPLLAALVALFLLALPVTGLQPLWDTGFAAAGLLGAALLMAALVNAVHEDGQVSPPALLRASARLGALVLPALSGLGLLALGLRLQQHGLTPDRVLGLIAALYAALVSLGYVWAALRPCMAPIGTVNTAALALGALLLVLLATPLLSPERISLRNQLARLESGAVSPQEFDLGLLRRRLGRPGQALLETPRFADIAALQRQQQAGEEPPAVPALWPEGASMPEGLEQAAGRAMRRSCRAGQCRVRLLDLDGDGQAEALIGDVSPELWGRREGGWSLLGRLNGCGVPTAALERPGGFTLQPAPWPEIVLEDGRRLWVERVRCP
ncbi:DUF4153 domain-containing protein [Teichococcus cervicalis]|uniref:DUF4153 domain-containing protein n=1 Tax=Teichococcus cervicalis TaxID=204525 RepID=UPI0002DB5A5F|nr:DUF4153 domain-containing protein [Pseudoroseomonas cervicalis]